LINDKTKFSESSDIKIDEWMKYEKKNKYERMMEHVNKLYDEDKKNLN